MTKFKFEYPLQFNMDTVGLQATVLKKSQITNH